MHKSRCGHTASVCPVVIAGLDESGEPDPFQSIRYRLGFEWFTRRRMAAASVPKINRVDFTPNPTLGFIIKASSCNYSPAGHGGVPLRFWSVVWDKEPKWKIETEGGVHTTHDGLDEGKDDAPLEDEVEEVLLVDGGQRARTSAPSLGPVSEGSNDRDEDNDVVHEEEGSQQSEHPHPAIQHPAPLLAAATPARQTRPSYDPAIPRRTTSSMGLFSSVSVLWTQNWHSIRPARCSNEDNDANDSVESSVQETTGTKEAESGRSVRPGATRRYPLPTVASPDGPALRRDPRRAEEAARQAGENQTLNVASNRLGGHDLRIFRDNVTMMNLNALNENGKRSPADGPATKTSFAKSKRMRARKSIDEIQHDIEEAVQKQSVAGADRLQRLEAEWREGLERGQIGRDEAHAAEKRRQEALDVARELREGQRRYEAAKEARRDSERDENKRRFEERICSGLT
ncbi:unnamed protein product [Phytophthora fragariaefolia]|uniref:Unnamed protein product n=1 Tax=Phytophthora fragariaefolia TaxID=1490495 RepID=A0A9W7CX22_9STRA|nr:unnamed protein product [Phytophthora fragariaefolia]